MKMDEAHACGSATGCAIMFHEERKIGKQVVAIYTKTRSLHTRQTFRQREGMLLRRLYRPSTKQQRSTTSYTPGCTLHIAHSRLSHVARTHLHSDAPREHVRDEELGAEAHVWVDIWRMIDGCQPKRFIVGA